MPDDVRESPGTWPGSYLILGLLQAQATLEKYVKGGDIDAAKKELAEHRQDIVMAKPINEIVKAVSSLYKEQRAIQQAPGMSGKDKQERIDQIQEKINSIAQRAYDLRPGGRLSPFQASKLIGATRQQQQAVLRVASMPATASLLGFLGDRGADLAPSRYEALA